MKKTKQTSNSEKEIIFVVIMLYTLNLYSAVCQLYLNKTERETKEDIQMMEKKAYLKKNQSLG